MAFKSQVNMEANSGEDDDDSLLSILELLNVKVVNKVAGDTGYHDDSIFYPPEYRNYAVEYLKHRAEIDQLKEKVNQSEQRIIELEKKLGHSEKENMKLKSSISEQQNHLAAAQSSLREQAKCTMKKNKEIADKEEKIKKLINCYSGQLIRKDEAIVQLQNDIKGLQDGHRQQLKCMKSSHKKTLSEKQKQTRKLQRTNLEHLDQLENVSQKIIELQSAVQNSQQVILKKEAENKELADVLEREERDKGVILNLWRKLSDTVKGCNDELETSLSAYVRECRVNVPAEYSINQQRNNGGGASSEEEGMRLQRNLFLLSFVIQDTLQGFLGSKKNCEGTQEDYLHQHQPSSSKIAHCTKFPDDNDDGDDQAP